MNRFIMNDRDQDAAPARFAGGGVRVMRYVWPAVVCVALMVGSAAALEDLVRGKGKKGDATKAPKVQKKATPRAGCGSDTGTPDPTPSAQSTKGGASPVWVCPEPNLTTDPVWRGQQIECAFMIRNEGTVDLKIKGRGG